MTKPPKLIIMNSEILLYTANFKELYDEVMFIVGYSYVLSCIITASDAT